MENKILIIKKKNESVTQTQGFVLPNALLVFDRRKSTKVDVDGWIQFEAPVLTVNLLACYFHI